MESLQVNILLCNATNLNIKHQRNKSKLKKFITDQRAEWIKNELNGISILKEIIIHFYILTLYELKNLFECTINGNSLTTNIWYNILCFLSESECYAMISSSPYYYRMKVPSFYLLLFIESLHLKEKKEIIKKLSFNNTENESNDYLYPNYLQNIFYLFIYSLLTKQKLIKLIFLNDIEISTVITDINIYNHMLNEFKKYTNNLFKDDINDINNDNNNNNEVFKILSTFFETYYNGHACLYYDSFKLLMLEKNNINELVKNGDFKSKENELQTITLDSDISADIKNENEFKNNMKLFDNGCINIHINILNQKNNNIFYLDINNNNDNFIESKNKLIDAQIVCVFIMNYSKSYHDILIIILIIRRIASIELYTKTIKCTESDSFKKKIFSTIIDSTDSNQSFITVSMNPNQNKNQNNIDNHYGDDNNINKMINNMS